MSTTVQLTGGSFQDTEGNVLANGYLLFELSQDAQVNGNTEICAGYVVKILLNSSGSVSTSPDQFIWGNDVLSPAGTYYTVSAYTAAGQLVWGPNAQQVTGTPTFNVGTWVPGSVNVVSGGGGGTTIELETNGTANSSQTTLNLTAGANITLTDEGSGAIQIAAAGSSVPSSPIVLNLNASPYNASVYGATTTTTVGTTAIGTSVVVASAANWVVGNGIYIAGAGSAGAPYIGQVTVISGTTFTISPATSTSVTSGALVQHDETAAFRAAIAAIAALPAPQGTIQLQSYLGNGSGAVYLVNGPLQDTSHANAILLMPSIASYSTQLTKITIAGTTEPPSNQTANAAGAIIQTSLATGNLIAGYATGGLINPFTNVGLSLVNLTFRTYSNPGCVVINGTNLLTLEATNVRVDAGSTSPLPTTTTGAAIIYPMGGNEVRLAADNVVIAGYYRGVVTGEHLQFSSIYGANCVNMLVVDCQSTQGNSVQGDYLWGQLNTNLIAAGSSVTEVYIAVADNEVTTSLFLNDPSNLLHGIINVNTPYNDGRSTSTVTTPSINGGTNVSVYNLSTGVTFGRSSGGGSGSNLLTAGLIEFWPSQEGQGTTFVNSGADFTNALTGTNTTQATATGFPGKVTTYNGTTSFAAAASATNTAFDGTLPFSVAAWVNPSTIVNNGDYAVVSNYNTSGFTLEVFGSGSGVGHPSVYIINTYPTNTIHVVGNGSGAATITTGALSHICFTYSGSKDESGVTVYVNGVAQLTTFDHNTLTGSAASATPVNTGRQPTSSPSSFFSGAIGGAAIWNRQLTSAEVLSLYNVGPQG